MKLIGKIIKIEERTYTNKEGEPGKVTGVLLEEISNDERPQQAYIEYFNKRADEFIFQPGQIIRTAFGFKVDEREHDGKKFYSNKLSGWGAALA